MTEAELRGAARRFGSPAPETAGRVLDRAAEEGLLDVAYASVESPFGPWLVATTPRGLVRIALEGSSDDVLQDLSVRISPRVLEAPSKLDAVRRELDEYLEGRRKRFEIALDWRLVRGFNLEVLRATAAIAYGSVSTYGEVALAAGSPRAARAAGNALHNNPIPVVVPCHRVLHAGGGLGGYGGGLDMKRALLELEGALAQ